MPGTRRARASPACRRPLDVASSDKGPPRRATDPTNMDEARRAFLERGEPPRFALKAPRERLSQKLASSSLHAVSTELLGVAEGILRAVKQRFGDADFADVVLGEPLTQEEASAYLTEYVRELGVTGAVRVRWTAKMGVAGKIVCRGSRADPNKRTYTIWAYNGPSSSLLRAGGIRTFAAHELGTHLLRSTNDRAQAWATSRAKFGLCKLGSRESQQTEEGLASLSTALHQPHRFLFSAALLYYAAARGQELSFKALFDELGQFVRSERTRFAAAVRVKKAVADSEGPGASGQPQVYLEGAVAILRELETLDLAALFAGKIALGALKRVQRLVRPNGVLLPPFAADLGAYRDALRAIGVLNGIISPPGPVAALVSTFSPQLAWGLSPPPKTPPRVRRRRVENKKLLPPEHEDGVVACSPVVVPARARAQTAPSPVRPRTRAGPPVLRTATRKRISAAVRAPVWIGVLP